MNWATTRAWLPIPQPGVVARFIGLLGVVARFIGLLDVVARFIGLKGYFRMKKRPIFPAILLLSLFFLFSPVRAEDPADIPAGELLFKEKCSMCHKTTDQALVGPGLQGIMERRDEKWVDKWLQDPGGLLKSGDKTATELKKGFFRTMPALPEMQDPVKRKTIIEYLKTLKQEG